MCFLTNGNNLKAYSTGKGRFLIRTVLDADFKLTLKQERLRFCVLMTNFKQIL